MGYTLRALIARCELLAQPPAWMADSAVIPLSQGFCMLPLSQALCWQFGPPDRPWLYTAQRGFTHLPKALVPALLELSHGGRLAYVEAEYDGAGGEQRSVGWDDGAPAREPEESSFAINAALQWLGVQSAGGDDAFDTLGLGRHRSVDDWLEDARTPTEPALPDPAPAPAQPPWWRRWR